MATEAAHAALLDGGIAASDVDRVFFGNAVAGVVDQQEMIRGQVALRFDALGDLPLVNVENACASGSSAFHLAREAIAGGHCEVALAIGAEQLSHEQKARTFGALRGSTDIAEIGEAVPGEVPTSSILMEFYAEEAARFLARSGAELADLARVAVKNRAHAQLNPLAQYREPQTIEQVLAARTIQAPLTLPMCSPVSDGAAAIALCSEAFLARGASARAGARVEVLTTKVRAGGAGARPVAAAASAAYEATALGPDDLDVVELHDAAAPAELIQYGDVGLCAEGEGVRLIRSGATALGGAVPVNTSGGLLSRGHPLGATGCAQIVELTTQLRGRAGERQVADARTALAINCGGWIDGTYALAVATILRGSEGTT
jgi:acetyl-CoA acetyltransferase